MASLWAENPPRRRIGPRQGDVLQRKERKTRRIRDDNVGKDILRIDVGRGVGVNGDAGSGRLQGGHACLTSCFS